MKICGLAKLTLLDYPQKTACTVFTGGCNFRCPFCHNSSLVCENDFEEAISQKDFLAFLDTRKKILDGVCITGGEPLIHNDIDDLLIKIKDKGFKVKLDTNGSNPDKLKSLVNNGLIDYVAMDVKNCKDNYAPTCGTQHIDIKKISESVDFLMSGTVDYEFRTTAINGIHTLCDFKKIAEWIAGNEKYFIQNFIDSGDILVSRNGENMPFSSFDADKINEFVYAVRQFVPNVESRGI